MDLFKKAFPNIDGDQINSLEAMLKQFRKRSFNFRTFPPLFEEYVEFQISKTPEDILMQGDIIDSLPMVYIDEAGDLVEIEGSAVILSASCDCENDDNILLASCFSLIELKKIVNNPSDLENNLYYKFFCFNNSSNESKSIDADFSRVTTYSKKIIETRISEGAIKKIYSLSQLGYYYFITKLYIHMLRIENINALNVRNLQAFT